MTPCPATTSGRGWPSSRARATRSSPSCARSPRARVPFVPRGAGTGLSGGALAGRRGADRAAPARRILSIDPVERVAVVEPGVVNAALTRAAAPFGLHYAPDPSSQTACTIGGNVAENAGGPHCLKYGVTLNHVLARDGGAARRRRRAARAPRRARHGLRPARRVRRLGGVLRHRARGDRAAHAESGGDPHDARGFHVGGRRRRRRSSAIIAAASSRPRSR